MAPADDRQAAFYTLDHGSATLAGALVGRVDGRWRLLAATALPTGSGPDALVALLARRLESVDPSRAEMIGGWAASGPAASADVPRLVARSRPAATLAVIAATDRTRTRLEEAAAGAGWNVVAGSAERTDPLELTRLATRPGVVAVLVGVADPPGADERELATELSVAAAAIAARRPGLRIFLAGPVPDEPLLALRHAPAIERLPPPPSAPGELAASPLRDALAAARGGPDDSRRALAAAAGSLARVLGLRVEILEIGVSGAARVLALPGPADDGGTRASVRLVEVPDAGLFRMDRAGAIDRIDHWFTQGVDRARLRDRVSELAIAPWSDLDGDGALLRAAALRGALERLLSSTDAELGSAGVDLLVGAGGAWSAVPGPAATHIVADVVRRPGTVQVAIDHARLLGPIGTIEDDAERDAVVADLAPDLLLPVGTIVTPRGLRPNRPAGQLFLETAGGRSEVDLVAGGLTLVDLPPGARGTAELAFRGTPELGPRGRQFRVAVSGGLAGLLLDLRDIPLRLPERPDRRRELLGTWERALWPERDS
ncbi:MAG TPA: hypothetical protein VF302_01060 [Candidatus Limnocylindrales bacterium]